MPVMKGFKDEYSQEANKNIFRTFEGMMVKN